VGFLFCFVLFWLFRLNWHQTGQMLAVSPVLPQEYIETLKVLMDNAIPQPLHRAQATWKDCFGTEMSESFASFEVTPIATASLAQVYRACLPDGKVVAVKVQHADVARLFRIDLDCMEAYYRLIGWLFPVLFLFFFQLGLLTFVHQEFDFTFFVKEVRRGFNEEMDFETEVANSVRVKKMLEKNKYVAVPAVHPKLCSDRVITMDFEEGVRVDDREGIKRLGIAPKNVAQTIVELFGQMMFVDGVRQMLTRATLKPIKKNKKKNSMSTAIRTPATCLCDQQGTPAAVRLCCWTTARTRRSRALSCSTMPRCGVRRSPTT